MNIRMEKNNKMTLTEEQIIKGNELIAKFMGYESYPFGRYTMWVIEDNNHRPSQDLHYHGDYNWIMDAVEWIDGIGFDVQISRISVKISRILENDKPIVSLVCGNTSKKNELLFQAIVEFIKWYNENKN